MRMPGEAGWAVVVVVVVSAAGASAGASGCAVSCATSGAAQRARTRKAAADEMDAREFVIVVPRLSPPENRRGVFPSTEGLLCEAI
jgi:hypothetical protein